MTKHSEDEPFVIWADKNLTGFYHSDIAAVDKYITDHLQAYASEIEKRVIGKNKRFKCGAGVLCDGDMCCDGERDIVLGANELKAEQRKALTTINQEWGLK